MHFLALAEETEVKIKGHEQFFWLARLDAEHDNVRAAITWLAKRDMEAALLMAQTFPHIDFRREVTVVGESVSSLRHIAPGRRVGRVSTPLQHLPAGEPDHLGYPVAG